MKSEYVKFARSAKSGLRAAGLMTPLDRWAQRSRTGTWARSLLSIYDVAELSDLDVPWWTFDSIAQVDAFLMGRRDARVFEWGSGASTLWLARRSGSVASIEHDRAWAQQLQELLRDVANVELHVVAATAADGSPGEARSAKKGSEGLNFRAYVDAIDEVGGLFDLIVIDGRAREACLERAIPHLASDGLIVFDNVDRRRYRDAIGRHAEHLDVTWTRGLTPSLPYPTRTSLIRRSSRE